MIFYSLPKGSDGQLLFGGENGFRICVPAPTSNVKSRLPNDWVPRVSFDYRGVNILVIGNNVFLRPQGCHEHYWGKFLGNLLEQTTFKVSGPEGQYVLDMHCGDIYDEDGNGDLYSHGDFTGSVGVSKGRYVS